MKILMDMLFVLFLLSPLLVAIILIIHGFIKKTETMFYTKIIGFTFGFFNIFFLILTVTDSGNGNGIFFGFGFFLFVLPVNLIAFFICVLSDLNVKSKEEALDEK